ncbi:hypothetical protein E4U41_004187 [Claviceps citrina]|nr:hypothetical protein E4U41_004187 [Claviceps citrina]
MMLAQPHRAPLGSRWSSAEQTRLSPTTFSLPRRRLLLAMCSRFYSPSFVFSLAAVSILVAKAVHIYTHVSALPTVQLHRWILSFFAQDSAAILVLRLLFDHDVLHASRLAQVPAKILITVFVFWVTALGTINTCFFLLTGSEIHWRNIAFASDASSRALLLSGAFTFLAVVCGLLAISWLFQDVLFDGYGLATNAIKWPCTRLRKDGSYGSPEVRYMAIDGSNGDSFDNGDDATQREFSGEKPGVWTSTLRKGKPYIKALLYCLVVGTLVAQFVLVVVRPHESSLVFLSWTSALLPFVDFSSSSPNLEKLDPFFGNGINHRWDNTTALRPTPVWPWLSHEPRIGGFADWYDGKEHYSAAADPLKISNLDSDIIPMLQTSLKDIELRHVMFVFLESTRKDVFPLKKNDMIWTELLDSYLPEALPQDAHDRLSNLTRNANYLTGDYDDGFEHEPDEQKRRGGINFNNAFTTSTYTLKSLTGTLCGVTPLVADFNLEYNHHIYQPCLAQIFDALNKVETVGTQDGFTGYKWVSRFMQSVTLDFDNFRPLMRAVGYTSDNLIDSEYLRSREAKFGPVELPDINYFGMVETPLEEYIRDSFSSARNNNERLFLSHITSTSHHPFRMPDEESYVPLANGKHRDLSHYLNAIGYDDRWLGRILAILEEEGASNNTLLVVVGDHGLSMPENDIVSSYYNPNVGSNHVPLVISHPQLPSVHVDDPVIASQILPTVLDLLLKTNSLAKSQKQALVDLLSIYEGQSLLREQKMATATTGQGNWQFTLVNPGRAMLSVRDARRPNLRLIVPVIDNVEWQFTELVSDPKEADPVQGFNFASFLGKIQSRFGRETARWAEEAAFISRWWVEENSRRWRYGPYSA